jgi:alkanesulfonate monooxygenase SsuD/methylene tetrahydromethanopterin reductase-like flavin-dependent oxidoreductase (luciferase family)
MADYGRELQFGVNIDPNAAVLGEARELARRADALGLDFLGVQDHPYQRRFLDTWMLMATLLASTERVRVFSDVTSPALRGPAMIAKQAVSLDVLSGGRFELGLGAGGFWDATAAMGGPKREPGEALQALEEAMEIIRLFWSGQRTIEFSGRHYSVKGLHPGPAPAHPIGIWVGGQSPRTLRLIGRLADGWAGPSPYYLPYEMWAAAQETIDTAARSAGRDPLEIRRIAPLVGTITDAPGPGWRAMGGDPIRASARQWATILAWLAQELRFDTFVFAPEQPSADQILQFGEEVASRTRELVRDGKVRRAS